MIIGQIKSLPAFRRFQPSVELRSAEATSDSYYLVVSRLAEGVSEPPTTSFPVKPKAINNLGAVVGQGADGQAFLWQNNVYTSLGTR